MAKPILDLSTLIERPKIVIDGQLYEIRNKGELTFVEQHMLGRLGTKFVKLGEIPDETDEWYDREYSATTKLLHETLKSILLAPEEILEKLSIDQKVKLYEAVFSEAGQEKEELTPPETTTSEGSSPDSNDSMEEVQVNG